MGHFARECRSPPQASANTAPTEEARFTEWDDTTSTVLEDSKDDLADKIARIKGEVGAMSAEEKQTLIQSMSSEQDF